MENTFSSYPRIVTYFNWADKVDQTVNEDSGSLENRSLSLK